MRTVYLATPIDGHQPASFKVDLNRVRQVLRDEIASLGYHVVDPASWESAAADPKLRERLVAAMTMASAVVAYFPDGASSLGVPIEIAKAQFLRKPLLVVGGKHVMQSPVLDPETDLLDVGDRDWQGSLASWLRMLRRWSPVSVPTARQPAAAKPDPLEWGPGERYLAAVLMEVQRAEDKHPEATARNGGQQWFAIWAEEVVEAFQAWNDRPIGADFTEFASELVQVGAMAAKLWESLSG